MPTHTKNSILLHPFAERAAVPLALPATFAAWEAFFPIDADTWGYRRYLGKLDVYSRKWISAMRPTARYETYRAIMHHLLKHDAPATAAELVAAPDFIACTKPLTQATITGGKVNKMMRLPQRVLDSESTFFPSPIEQFEFSGTCITFAEQALRKFQIKPSRHFLHHRCLAQLMRRAALLAAIDSHYGIVDGGGQQAMERAWELVRL